MTIATGSFPDEVTWSDRLLCKSRKKNPQRPFADKLADKDDKGVSAIVHGSTVQKEQEEAHVYKGNVSC